MPNLSGNKVDFGIPKRKRGAFTTDPDLLKFYNSSPWRKTSYFIRKVRDKYCVICKKKGLVKLSEHCDHKKPISKGGSKLGHHNLQGICKDCHFEKTGSE